MDGALRTSEEPLVTALIVNYNYGRFLAEAIESALAQTYPRLEVLVMDDGSTDDSREVLRRYEGRVRTILKANGGQASALNAGIAAARGEIICFLDSDDAWSPGKVAAVVAKCREAPCALVGHDLLIRGSDGMELPAVAWSSYVDVRLRSRTLFPGLIERGWDWPFPPTSGMGAGPARPPPAAAPGQRCLSPAAPRLVLRILRALAKDAIVAGIVSLRIPSRYSTLRRSYRRYALGR